MIEIAIIKSTSIGDLKNLVLEESKIASEALETTNKKYGAVG